MKKAVLFGFLLFNVLFNNLTAQENKLFQLTSVSFDNLSLDSAINVLEDKTDINFTYNSEYIVNKNKITAKFNFVPLSIILDSLFSDPCINYKIIKNQLVVHKRKNIETNTYSGSINNKTIKGKITNAKNGESLSYSSIGILNKNTGTISNKNGDFILNLNKDHFNDTIIISHLGFLKLILPVNKINNNTDFSLTQKTVSLPEIVIRNYIPDILVRRAIQNTKSNYFIDPFILRAFYRETIMQNNKYMIYSEGLLDIYKRPFRPTLYQDQIRLIKQRKFTNISKKDSVLFKLKGGLRTSLQLDIIRNKIEFIELKKMHNYEYKIHDMVISDGKPAYLVAFSPKSKKKIPAFEGKIYIESESLAFLKIEFGYTPRSIRNLKSNFVLKKSRKIKAIPDAIKYNISYKESNGKYYIYHVRGNLRFKVKRKGKLLRSIYSTSFEMVSTDINLSSPIRFSKNETMKTNKIFSDQNKKYDIKFWGNNNFILPEENLIKVLERFNKEELEIN